MLHILKPDARLASHRERTQCSTHVPEQGEEGNKILCLDRGNVTIWCVVSGLISQPNSGNSFVNMPNRGTFKRGFCLIKGKQNFGENRERKAEWVQLYAEGGERRRCQFA